MFEFMNYGESILSFVFFLVALYLYRSSKDKSYFLSIITGLMFAYTLFGMPFTQKNKAEENIASYEEGISLSCASGFLVFGSTYNVDKNQWQLEGNYFINTQVNEKIRADKCEKK